MRSKEGTERKLARDRERVTARVLHGEVFRFMGSEFESVGALRAAYPAFAGDDAIRAIRAGCETVTDVETFCWKRRNDAYLRARAAAQRSQYGAMHALGTKDQKRAAAKRGGAATKARRKAA